MNVTVRDTGWTAAQNLGFIDCDVHPFRTPTPISTRSWRRAGGSIGATIGGRSRQGLAGAARLSRMSPGNGQRRMPGRPTAARPAPISDHAAATARPVRRALRALAPLVGRRGGGAQRRIRRCDGRRRQRVAARAFCDPEPRLKASSVHAGARGRRAVAEIERRAGDRRFAQVQIPPRGLEPLGRRRYWPILEASRPRRLPDLAASRRHQWRIPPPAAGCRPSTTRNIPPTCSPCRPW